MGWYANLSVTNLMGFAGLIGLTGGLSALTITLRKRRKLTELPFRTMAINILHKNKPALELLGEPIEVGQIEPCDRCNFASLETGFGALKIPLRGKTNKGDLYVMAKTISKKSEPKSTDTEIEWRVNKVELHLEGALQDKKFIIFKTDDNSLSTKS